MPQLIIKLWHRVYITDLQQNLFNRDIHGSAIIRVCKLAVLGSTIHIITQSNFHNIFYR